ncbi:MAG: hypothetical protein ACI4JE_02990 [Ruminococcus sp.]
MLGLLIVVFQPNNKLRAETEENIYETEIYDMVIDETLQNNCEVEEIKGYKKMLNDGLITEEEFTKKSRFLEYKTNGIRMWNINPFYSSCTKY